MALRRGPVRVLRAAEGVARQHLEHLQLLAGDRELDEVLEGVPAFGLPEMIQILIFGIPENLDALVSEQVHVPGEGKARSMKIAFRHVPFVGAGVPIDGLDGNAHGLPHLAHHERHRDRLFLEGLGASHGGTEW